MYTHQFPCLDFCFGVDERLYQLQVLVKSKENNGQTINCNKQQHMAL